MRGIGELAKLMLARAFAAGVPAEWVVGDSVYGYDELRLWLEAQHKNYVLAVSETHQVWVQGWPQPVGLVAALLPEEARVVLSRGVGSKGPRLYEWTWLQLPDEMEGTAEHARWVLIRRSLANRSERAYYRVYGPATTPLAEVVRVASSRLSDRRGL